MIEFLGRLRPGILLPEKRRLTLKSQIVGFLAISCLFNSCEIKIHPPPPTSSCTFTIKNILSTCHYPTSSTNIVSYTLDLIVYYINGSDKRILDEKKISSSGTQPWTQVTIISKLPSDGTSYQVEVIVKGTQCSTCALTQYGPNTCLQIPSGSGYTAGIPQWHYLAAPTGVRRSTYTVAGWYAIDNVSCGCVVPN